MTGATVPAGLLPDSTGPETIVAVAQCILYFSLFSTLLAALLAVLGKQWLLHYDSVGELRASDIKWHLRENGNVKKSDGVWACMAATPPTRCGPMAPCVPENFSRSFMLGTQPGPKLRLLMGTV
ncbi:hypothetical protein K438DRAFT_1782096 [Mycena galopus ATCC 62051]|nr:hypothetical protein K438DRAFT_1782096 [Mycena galopus ATCC 62051]